jgi:NAD(P)-dependent dehydrogenase (short-subunit alcohol dehydrogenase family)
MPRRAVLISGTAARSLGSLWIRAYARRAGDAPVVAIDREHDPALRDLRNVSTIAFDLNPLNPSPGFVPFVEQLHAALASAHASVGFDGLSTFISAAGVYDSGPLVDSTVEGRRRLLGVNVCGKLELLVAALALNQRLGFDSASELSFLEIGSLRGLQASPGRAAYAASKAFGLDLCISLEQEGAVKRTLYVAPGPIDTHMLHRNYWVTKEGGPVEFLQHVRTQRADLYRDIFIRCDPAAFAEAAASAQMSRDVLAPIFERYKARRTAQLTDPRGILDAAELAEHLVDIAADEAAYSSGVYVFTAPGGRMRMEKLAYSDLVRRD